MRTEIKLMGGPVAYVHLSDEALQIFCKHIKERFSVKRAQSAGRQKPRGKTDSESGCLSNGRGSAPLQQREARFKTRRLTFVPACCGQTISLTLEV